MKITKLTFGVLVSILSMLVIFASGCSSTQEVVYKTISFSDTNGVTTVYYPITMEKDMIHAHQDERWKYAVSKNASDDGKAKPMLVKP